MKGLHNLTPLMRYEGVQYLTEQRARGARNTGLILDRWAENGHPLGLWVAPDNERFIIHNQEDEMYFAAAREHWFKTPEERLAQYREAMHYIRESVTNGNWMEVEWWIGTGHVPDPLMRSTENVIGLDPIDPFMPVILLDAQCEIYGHDWDGDYCTRCEAIMEED